MTETFVCPDCQGHQQTYALVRYAGPEGCREEMVSCIRCAGKGHISRQHRAAIEEGDRLRAERLARDETIREMALRTGMTPVEISDRELAKEWRGE